MAVTLADLDRWLASKETEHLEFKEAKNGFSADDLRRYVVAIGNEGGGHLVLGVTNKIPRAVVGTNAFENPQKAERTLHDKFRRVVRCTELPHADGRVVVFEIPSREIGSALDLDGQYLMRLGESVVPMPPERLRAILSETVPDFSAEPNRNATTTDLDPAAVARLVELWAKKTGDETKRALGDAQALADLGLVRDAQITNAALILLGKPDSLRRHLADAEIIFEYRSSDGAIEHAVRREWRAGFLLVMDEVWQAVSARNDIQHMQEGFFIRDIPVQREDVVREAILNGVCHRDYRQGGSVFVKQWPRRLEVASPGGLPSGVTVENIVTQHRPRNRLLAEVLQQIGLVERSGQGMDKMFRRSIADGKMPPDFTGTDAHNVVVTLHGEVQDPRFIRYLERVGQEKLATFSTLDFLTLDHVRRGIPVPDFCAPRVSALLHLGVIERAGKKLILSQSLYSFLGERGKYTRAKGLDRDTQKALIEKHLREVAGEEGAALEEICQVLGPATGSRSVQRLLNDMKEEGRVVMTGRTRSARWFAVGQK